MNYFKLSLSTIIILPFTGCALITVPSDITSQSMKQFSTPSSVIAAKNLNGKNGTGKEYHFTSGFKEATLPFTYMKRLCESQNGGFGQIQRSTYAYLDKRNNLTPKTMGSELSPSIGTFECRASSPWYVSIEPISSRYGGSNNSIDLINLKTSEINKSALNSTLQFSNAHQNVQNNEIRRVENERIRKLEAERSHQEAFLAANKPLTNDIGKTICKETVLSAYTGMLILGQPHFRSTNGTVIASLETFSNDGLNIKINIKGFLNTQNGISAGNDVLYNQIPLEAGKTVWDNKSGWFKCNY